MGDCCSQMYYRTLSPSRIYFYGLKLIASQLICPSNVNKMVTDFRNHSRHRVRDLKMVFLEGQMKANIGRMLIYFRFLEELKLTEKEWEEVYQFLIA